CHASGFIALVAPLIEAGILPCDALLSCHSVTGYSGGGKKMIAEYEADEMDELLTAPRQYALGQSHKHLKEMKAICALESEPLFSPIVSDFYSGMCVTVPLFKSQLADGKTADDIIAVYKGKYHGPIVSYEDMTDGGFLSATALAGKDSMRVCVFGNEDRILLTAVYDNLGKGASGAAIECMNYVLGTSPDTGLEL
ncbi:MAG: N-acetyl-gamma-glutamyl-phosphate reductase, partial [Clostridia bacterium]|nr:N-acetyl-gamma-glutamyl-phosphate reductase [Clostridia bacterium]